MGKIYMIGAMKGGVGKSVSVFNLAYSLKKRGKKVLAVDFDPQSNLTTCFGAEEVDVAIGDLMMNVIEEEDLPEREEYIWERNGVDFIRNLMDMADRATKKLKKRTDKTQSENLKLAKKLEKLQKDKKKCETERFANVDRFMAGELEKDDYLRVRQELSRKAECLDQQIAEVTAKLRESEAAADDGTRDAVATMKKYSGEQELTKEIVDVFIDRILIYDPRHIEIQWKLPDEVIKFIEG